MKLIVNGETVKIPTSGGGGTGASIPSGGIIIWSGAADAVPDGWALCDGTNGTPDLRGRFVLGSSSAHAIGSKGGSETVTLTVEQLADHTHRLSLYTKGTTNSNGVYAYSTRASAVDNSVETRTMGMLNNLGGTLTKTNQPHNNMPPYYTLAYIMKL